MPLTQEAKEMQEQLLRVIGQTPGDLLDGADGPPKALISWAGTAAASDVALPLRFDDRNTQINEGVRFMNTLSALLVNHDVKTLTSYSAVLEATAELIGEIDTKIRESLDAVYHDPGFQELEAAWRSLHDLSTAVTQDDVIIDFLDVSKEELRADIVDNEGDIFAGELFRKVYVAEYDRYGGKPFAAMIGLYQFDSGDEDIAWLRAMGKVANASHCPFISAADPSFFYPCKTMEEVANIGDLDALLRHPRFSKWNELRDTDYAAYLGLTLPRYLMRTPWGDSGRFERVNSIGYAETVHSGATGPGSNFLWGNTAILFAKNMVRSYQDSGWAQHIRGPKAGGVVEGLAVHTYLKNGYEEMQPPLEIAMADYRELQFAQNGFIPLVHKKNEAVATFFSAQSIKKSRFFIEELNTQNAHLVTNLAYTFSITRIAHFVKRMMREYIGSTADGEYVQRVLSEWLGGYVTSITNPDDLTLLYYPFKVVSVEVEPKPGPLGWYKAVISVLPHMQFEGMDVELRLEAALGGP
jgi:type VI secretion system protein ImpC